MKRNSKLKGQRSKKTFLNRKRLAALFLGIILVVIVIKDLSNSLFFKPKDRLNLVFFGQKTTVYSLGIKDGVNYYLSFLPDVRVNVPGAYGYYRVGALGKLSYLEKKPDIFKRTFSIATSSFVDYYFYSKKTEVFYGQDNSQDDLVLPTFWQVLNYQSNTSFSDRVYLLFYWLGKRKNNFLKVTSVTDIVNNDNLFSDADFFDRYQGYLYRKSYRSERKTVQIIYTKSYSSANKIGRMIEGNGIRVVDLSYDDPKKVKNCQVVENGDEVSKTARDLGGFFGCPVTRGKTEVSDIILILGRKEDDWLISQN